MKIKKPVTDTTPYTQIPERHRIAETGCVTALCPHIPKGTDVVEFFGGLGLLTEVFLREIQPKRLVTCELDNELYQGLREKFERVGTVIHGDALETCFAHIALGDFVSLDFNKFTTLRMILNSDLRETLSRTSDLGARYIHLTDCASFRLHFHWDDYTKRFGTPVTCRATYAAAVAPFYYDLLGWEIVDWRAHRGAFHFLFKT